VTAQLFLSIQKVHFQRSPNYNSILSSCGVNIIFVFSLLLLRRKAYEITFLSVSPKLFNQLGYMYEILLGGHAIEDDLDAVIFNPVASIKIFGRSNF
jgi:hypothetical protein